MRGSFSSIVPRRARRHEQQACRGEAEDGLSLGRENGFFFISADPCEDEDDRSPSAVSFNKEEDDADIYAMLKDLGEFSYAYAGPSQSFLPQVSGAMSGLLFGEAAHRLVKNSLQIKANSAGLLDTPYNRRNSNSHSTGKTKSARPLGYEGSSQNPNFYRHPHTNNSRDFSNMRNNTFRMHEQFSPQDQFNTGRDISQLWLQDGPRYRPEQRMAPNAGISQIQHPPIQNNGSPPPPPPPTNWIDKHSERVYTPSIGEQMPCFFKQPSLQREEEEQEQQYGKKVYRIKSRQPET